MNDLTNIEHHLQKNLRSVAPRPEFERALKSRLMNKPAATIRKAKLETKQYLLLTGAGLLSGTILLVFGVRAVIRLLNALGLLQQMKPSMVQERATLTKAGA
jgi:hypothetical protein